MIRNPVVDTLLNRKSIRKYKAEQPADEVVRTIVRAGQQAPYYAEEIAQQYKPPQRVFPWVQLVMGYPDEAPPARPRYPAAFTLFEDEYPHLDTDAIRDAMKPMDEGYLMEGYYRRLDAKISLEDDRQDGFTYDNYSWTEHISRKAGQWDASPQEILEQFAKRGFHFQGHGAVVSATPDD